MKIEGKLAYRISLFIFPLLSLPTSVSVSLIYPRSHFHSSLTLLVPSVSLSPYVSVSLIYPGSPFLSSHSSFSIFFARQFIVKDTAVVPKPQMSPRGLFDTQICLFQVIATDSAWPIVCQHGCNRDLNEWCGECEGDEAAATVGVEEAGIDAEDTVNPTDSLNATLSDSEINDEDTRGTHGCVPSPDSTTNNCSNSNEKDGPVCSVLNTGLIYMNRLGSTSMSIVPESGEWCVCVRILLFRIATR
jgi:hypothetical protein